MNEVIDETKLSLNGYLLKLDKGYIVIYFIILPGK